MKAIKAYVRREKVEEIHRALARAGFGSMTVANVEGTGGFQDPARSHLSLEFSFTSMGAAKIEMISKAEDVEQVVQIIQEHGKTGYAGDGIIVVSPVERAVHIRTGEEGRYIV